ncbi:hypothetical protein [Armatimonas sp.]|uniref:hypothetical protein n=1 Tax=Armatimonas sp. TaxID=1872638 RepID=UPI0037500A14
MKLFYLPNWIPMIRLDDLTGPEIQQLLLEHLFEMRAISPHMLSILRGCTSPR